LLHRNVTADKISDALQLLLQCGLAVFERRGGVHVSQGPPTEYWRPR
jgi:hypothetical protein